MGSDAAKTWGRGEIVSLTSLRGLAAVGVAACHLSGDIPILSRQYLWVDFFFILSGFIMCHAYSRTFHDGATAPAVGKFLRARFFRVYPLHLITLTALLAFESAKLLAAAHGQQINHPAFTSPNTTHDLLLNVFLIQSWGLADAHFNWNMPAWSISTELAAYLLFPILLTLVMARRQAVILITCAAVAGLLALWAHDGALTQPTLLRCLCEFWLGMCIWHLGPPTLAPRLRAAGQIAVAAATIALMLVDRVPDIAIVPWFALAVALLGTDTGPLAKALAWRPLHTLGLLSYSIYMTHFVVMQMLGRSGLPWGALLLTVIAVSALTYRYIETPARRWGAQRNGANLNPVTDAP